MEQNLYTYKAQVLKIVDADTFTVKIDVGFRFYYENDIRLLRINAFETKLGKNTTADMKATGLAGKDYVKKLLEGKEIIIKTVLEKEKFGRILAEVFYKQNDVWINLNDDLVNKKYAIYQVY